MPPSRVSIRAFLSVTAYTKPSAPKRKGDVSLLLLVPPKSRPRMRAKSRATFCAGRCLGWSVTPLLRFVWKLWNPNCKFSSLFTVKSKKMFKEKSGRLHLRSVTDESRDGPLRGHLTPCKREKYCSHTVRLRELTCASDEQTESIATGSVSRRRERLGSVSGASRERACTMQIGHRQWAASS